MTCRTGGADGSDMCFEFYGEQYGIKIIAYSFNGHNIKSKHVKILSNDELNIGYEHIKKANKSLKRYIGNLSLYVKNLLSRNWYQVNESESIFAIGILQNEFVVSGGTGWAVQEAIDNKKEVYLFEQNENKWFKFSYVFNKFQSIDFIPDLTENFAGIGTRNINQNGIKAIKELYEKKFSK